MVRDLTDSFASSALLVVTVGGMTTLPTIVVGPWAGVLGDRINRRKLVMAVQSFMAVAAITFALVIQSGHVSGGMLIFTFWYPESAGLPR